MTTTIIPTESGTYTAVYQNTCTCTVYDEATGEYTDEPADDCWGDCWESVLLDFTNITAHLFSENNQGFRITGFPVWNGTVDGYFSARNAKELLDSITPDRTEWRLEVTVHADHLTGVLSHHDAPMGGTIVVTPFSDDI
jgi:hypothetical protein